MNRTTRDVFGLTPHLDDKETLSRQVLNIFAIFDSAKKIEMK